jgi:hypothetical protein
VRPKSHSLAYLVLALASASVLGGRASAATHTWTGTNSSLWSDPGNWTGGTPLGDPNAALVFPAGVTRLVSTDDLPGENYVASIELGMPGYTLDATPGSSIALFGNFWMSGNPQGVCTSSTLAIPVRLVGSVEHRMIGSSCSVFQSWAKLLITGPLSGDATEELTPANVEIFSSGPFSGGIRVVDYVHPADSHLGVFGSLANDVIVAPSSTLYGTGTVGSVRLSGGPSSEDSAVISPGAESSTGVLFVSGSVSAGANSPLKVRLNGTTPGSGHDQLRVGGTYVDQAS